MTMPKVVLRRSPTRWEAWAVRGFLALLLIFFSEVVFLTDPMRPWWTWPLMVIGYVALSAVLLDLLVRFRVYDLFGLMILGGVYGLGAALLINPAATLFDLPGTLLTRVMAVQSIAGMLGLFAFLGLTDGKGDIRLLIAAGVIGGVWGMWGRGFPTLSGEASFGLVPMLISAGVMLILLIAALLSAARAIPSVPGLLLDMREAGGVGGVLAALLAIWLATGAANADGFSAVLVLVVFAVMVLWFQRRQTRPETAIDDHIPLRPISIAWLVGLAVVFLAAGVAGYQIPPPPDETSLHPLRVLLTALTTFGLVWLPTTSLVLGVRGYRQTVRTGKLL